MVTLSVLVGVALAAGSYLLWLRPATPEPAATALTTMRPPGAGNPSLPRGGATGSMVPSTESAPPTETSAETSRQPATTAAAPPPATSTTTNSGATSRAASPQGSPPGKPDTAGSAATPEDPGPPSSIPPTAHPGPPSTSIPPTVETGSAAAEVVARVNAERASVGCGPLRVDGKLTAAAQAHSDDMSAHGYLSHDSRTGQGFVERMEAGGYPEPAAENIAMGLASPEAVMDAWMSSPGHRQNILDCEITAIGVGVNTSGWYWTQDFGY